MNVNRFRTTDFREKNSGLFLFLPCLQISAVEVHGPQRHPTSLKHSFCFSHQTALIFTSNTIRHIQKKPHIHTQPVHRKIHWSFSTWKHPSVDSATRSVSQPYEVTPSISNPSTLFLQSIIKFLFFFIYLQKREKKQILHTMQMLQRLLSGLKGSCLIVMCYFASLSLG